MSNRCVDRGVGWAGVALAVLLLLMGFLSYRTGEATGYQTPEYMVQLPTLPEGNTP